MPSTSAKPAALPPQLLPMLATSTREPFDDADCLFEIKWDGVRALAAVDHDGIRLWGREGVGQPQSLPRPALHFLYLVHHSLQGSACPLDCLLGLVDGLAVIDRL